MTHNWDLLGDRRCPPDIRLDRASLHADSLGGLPGSDDELFAAMAAIVARYTSRSEIVLGWSDGGSWRPIAITVAFDKPFDALVRAAAVALAEPTAGPVPSVGIGRAPNGDGAGPELLAVCSDGTIEYATGLYRPADVLRFAGHLATLCAARGSAEPIGRLPMLAPAELAALHAGNASRPVIDDRHTIDELIGAQFERNPDAVAVLAGGRELTYAQLWQRSAALAARLTPGSLVGVWADRTVEMMVALVAVLRAGAAYVALEPSYPAARLRAVTRAAHLSAVIGDVEIGALGAAHPDIITATGDDLDRATRAVAGPRPDDLAYVMFTSGSTGEPKGVMIEHRNVVNLLRHMAEQPGLHPGEVMLGVTTPAFDLSVPDLFLPLVTGATLALVDADTARDAARLVEAIDQYRPDLMQATPATWRMLFAAGWRGAPLMRVVCGGEGYDAATARALDERVAGVWNFYGPTETTVWSVSTRLDKSVRDPIPIGIPMRATACYVLDERGEPAPPGVRGELHIAGAGVARGYLRRPDLTDAAFVRCDVPGAPSARMYRTGDLVRVSPVGELTFVGRRDFQVKVNGFRIELGEIETVLAALPRVTQAVAVVRDSESARRLVGYVTGEALDPQALRAAAAERLPPQSVPAVIVVVDAFALSSNGKIDRDALPAPAERLGQAPVGPAEELVARVCAEVLGLPCVYADDDVFALGAYSLDIGRIAIRLTAELSIDIPPGLIFRNSTVRALAQALPRPADPVVSTAVSPVMSPVVTEAPSDQRFEDRLAALSGAKRALLERALLERRRTANAAITPRDRSQPAPLSSSQQRLWFFEQLWPGEPTYNAVVAVWLCGDLDVDLLEAAVRGSIERHEVLRTVITVSGDEPEQHVLDDWRFGIEHVTADADTPAERAAQAVHIAAAAAREPYDLAHDLTLRVVLVSVEPRRWLLAFLQHHIAFDGWSDEILFAEVSEYYRLVHAGEAAPSRSPVPVQYADYARWQHDRIASGQLDAEAEHWRRVFRGAAPLLALPLDRPRPDQQSFAGRHLALQLDHAAGVRALRQEVGATDFMVLVAAWIATLYRWSGQSDITLGTPMANRNRVELEPLIGFFANTVPLRVQVEGAQTFRELVHQVRAVALEAFDHQDLPFEKIVEAVAPPRDPRINPLFQVNVRVQSGPAPRVDLPVVVVEPVHIDLGFSRFDLAIEFQITADVIGGYVEFNNALLDESTVRAVLQRLDAVLGAGLADPDRPIWDLPQPSTAPSRRKRAAS